MINSAESIFIFPVKMFILLSRSSAYPLHVASIINSRPRTASYSIFHTLASSTERCGTPTFVSTYSSTDLYFSVHLIIWYHVYYLLLYISSLELCCNQTMTRCPRCVESFFDINCD